MDYASIATALSSELTTALPAFAAVIALVIGIPLAFRVIRRIVR